MVFLLIFRGHLARAEIAGENSPEGCRIPKRSIILFLSHLIGNADKNTVLREGVAWFRWGQHISQIRDSADLGRLLA